MNSRFVKILVAWLCLSGTLISFQNCSGGFSVEDQVGSIDSASSVLAAPDVVFMAASDTVNTSSVTVQFQVMGSASSVMCSLNGAAATDCSSQSVTYNNLADGDYTVDVTASSGSGANTRRRTLRKDSTAPVINVSMMPPASTSMTTASFVFTASDNLSGVMSVQCSLDNAAFAACASPVNLSALSQAAHNFRIQARDNAGNMSAIYSYNWTVAAAGTPSVTLSSAPSSVINSSSASFIFSGLNSVSFECSVDSGAFVACTSPHVLSSVAAGNHNFRVQGVSSSGVRSSPAQANWIVDVTAPSAPNVVGNVPATTNMTSASFTFSSADTNGVARFECSQDSGAYSTCTSPRALSGLSAGNRSFAVRAVDNAGNTSAVTTFSWVIDVTPPTLAFTQTPAASTTATTAIFAFNSSEQAQCSLDNAAFANCTSPVNVSGLSVAAHSFRVQARDAAGNSTLISHSWTVTSTTPPPSSSSYSVSSRIAAFHSRLRQVRVAAGQPDSSPFSELQLPSAPVITTRITVSNAAEMAAASRMNGVEVTFSGSGFVGSLSIGSATDQRWIFPAGFTLTSPVDSYAIVFGNSRRIELVGRGGRVIGGTFGSGHSDLRLSGMDIRTRTDSPQVYLDTHSMSFANRVLIEGSYIFARSYAMIYDNCVNFVVANSVVHSAGYHATARTSLSDLVLWMDSRLITDGSQMLQRAHVNTNRFATWNVQMEGGTGVYVGPAGETVLNAEYVVHMDNRYYGPGSAVVINSTVDGNPNVTTAIIVGNRGYTNYETGSQLMTGSSGAGWIVGDNLRFPQVAPPAWNLQ